MQTGRASRSAWLLAACALAGCMGPADNGADGPDKTVAHTGPAGPSFVLPRPRIGETVEYLLNPQSNERIRFEVKPIVQAGLVRVAFTRNGAEGEVTGFLELDARSGEPARIVVGDPYNATGGVYLLRREAWFLARYFPDGYYGRGAYFFATSVHRFDFEALLPFAFWGVPIDLDGRTERPFWGFNLSVTSERLGPGRFGMDVSFPSFDHENRALVGRTFRLEYDEASAFPSRYVRGARSVEGSPITPGSDEIPWHIGNATGDEACVGGLPAITKHPSGAPDSMPFALESAMAAASSSPKWSEYAAAHPDWFLNRATYVNESAGTAGVRYTWFLNIGFPEWESGGANDFRGFRVSRLALGPNQDPYVEGTSDTLGLDLPRIEGEGIQVRDLGDVLRDVQHRHPGSRVDLIYQVENVYPAGRLATAITDAAVHDGKDAPLEFIEGGSGCLLEISRNVPATF